MTWLVWRQHRAQFYVGTALLAALAVLLVITGVQMASQYHSALVACAANHSCANLSSTLFLGSHAVGFLVIMTLGVPALLGVFWGAPLVAQELETGTSQFAWVQSVTRRRWLAVKTGWLLLAAAAWGSVSAANFHRFVTYQPAGRYWAFQGHRDRHFRGPGRGPDRPHRPGDPPPRHLTPVARGVPRPVCPSVRWPAGLRRTVP